MATVTTKALQATRRTYKRAGIPDEFEDYKWFTLGTMGALFALSIALFLIFEVFGPEIMRRRAMGDSVGQSIGYAKEQVNLKSTMNKAFSDLEGEEGELAKATALAHAQKYAKKLPT